jgi:DNA modification methylase
MAETKTAPIELEPITWRQEERRVADLVPHHKNPRKWKKGGKAQLDESVDRFGLIDLFVCNADGTLIDGHGRIEREIEKGNGERIVKVNLPSRMLTEPEVAELLVRLGLHGRDWDIELLKDGFFEGIDFKGIGMDSDDLKDLFANEIIDADEDDGPGLLPTGEQVVTVMGDVWELLSVESGLRHRIINGDCTHADVVAKVMAGARPNLMVTDPPYGVEYDPAWRQNEAKSMKRHTIKSTGKVKNDDRADWREAWSLFEGDVCYVWHGGKASRVVAESLEVCGFEIAYQIIWNKTNGAIGRGDFHWKHEPCFYAVRKGKKHNWQGARDQWTVWDIANLSSQKVIEEEGQTGHGTQKPIECMARPIKNNSAKGEVIYDPFHGSGSTVIACEQLQRHCRACELDERYVDVQVRRWVRWMEKNGLAFEVLHNGEPAGEKLEALKRQEGGV